VIRAAALLLALIAGPALAQLEAGPNPRVSPQIAEFAYGIYCPEPPERLEAAPGTAAGVVNIVDTIPEIEHAQTIIPAALGVGFGVVLQAGPEAVFDPVIVTITHPPYPDSGIEVEQWVTSVDGLSPGLIGFSFELRSELVVGPWTFTGLYGDEELFHIAFEVVPPGLMPDISDLCAGAFMS
jgi:hypothetical protein